MSMFKQNAIRADQKSIRGRGLSYGRTCYGLTPGKRLLH